MSDHFIPAGSTAPIVNVPIRNSSTGALQTGLTYSALTIAYHRAGESNGSTGVTTSSGTLGTYVSASVVEAGTSGTYQFCPTVTSVAIGSPGTLYTFKGAGLLDATANLILTGQAGSLGLVGTHIPVAAYNTPGGSAVLNAAGNVGADLQTAKGNAVVSNGTTTLPAGTLSTLGGTPQSGDAYAIVTNGTYGNAQLSRPGIAQMITPADTIAAVSGQQILSGLFAGQVVIRATDANGNALPTAASLATVIQYIGAVNAGVVTPAANVTKIQGVVAPATAGKLWSLDSAGNATVGQSGDAYAVVTNGTYGSAALATALGNLNNLSALANLYGPAQMEVPATGSIAYPFKVVVRDTEGHLEDLSALPAIAATNAAGTSRAANLSVVTHVGTGVYTFTYTVSAGATQEGLSFDASGTAASDSTARHAYGAASVVAIDTVTAIAAIRAKTDLIATDNGDGPAAQAAQQSIASNLPVEIPTISPSGLAQAFWQDSEVYLPATKGAILTGISAAVSAQAVRDAMELPSTLGSNHSAGSVATKGDAMLPVTPPDGYGSQNGLPPDGTVRVDHNTGGTDALRIVDTSSNPVVGAVIRAYRQSEYAVSSATATLRGETVTGSDGRWLQPMYLATAMTYSLVITSSGRSADTIPLTLA